MADGSKTMAQGAAGLMRRTSNLVVQGHAFCRDTR